MADDRDVFAQAMWDALTILGFDTDGDKTPDACLPAMGADWYIRMFLDHVRQHRLDHDALLDEEERPRTISWYGEDDPSSSFLLSKGDRWVSPNRLAIWEWDGERWVPLPLAGQVDTPRGGDGE